MAVCRKTLKREVSEEIGISIALNNIEPFMIYSNDCDTSRNHLAVCFQVSIDEDSIKLNLDSQELILNKGKSKSGKFLSFEELQEFELEEWSKRILKYCFNTNGNQLTLFDTKL